MSKETIDEIIDKLADAKVTDISSIVEEIIDYGFADDTQLSVILQIEDGDLDALVTYSGDIDDKTFKKYKASLLKFLKNERKSYERLYFKSKE